MKNFMRLIMTATLLVAGHAQAAFVGAYDVANWTQSIDGGSIDTSGAPNSVVLMSSDSGGYHTYQDFTITAVADGIISFNWSYITDDFEGSSFDPFGFLYNGDFNQLTKDGLYNETGNYMFYALAGDVFGFSAYSFDSSYGAATITISNFKDPSQVPVPSALWLIGAPLLSLLHKKRKVIA